MAKDYKLIEQLRANAPELLKILSANGVDVSKYQALSKEIAENKNRRKLTPEEKEQRRLKRIENKLKKEQEQARVRAYEIATQGEISGGKIQIFAERIRAEEQAKKKKTEREQAEIMKAIKEIALTVAPEELQKEQEQGAIIGLRSVAQRINPNTIKEEQTKQAKASFIKYYCDNWFFILLDLMKEQPREKRSKHNERLYPETL